MIASGEHGAGSLERVLWKRLGGEVIAKEIWWAVGLEAFVGVFHFWDVYFENIDGKTLV